MLVDGKLQPTKASVKMPLGQGELGEFSDDGKRIITVWSAPDSPTDIYSIDPSSGKVEPLRNDARAALATMPKIKSSIVEVPAFDGGKIFARNRRRPDGTLQGAVFTIRLPRQ